MIPKPLDDIEWADLEALKASGREEGDTIEYKGGFSGGLDFLAFSDSERTKAVRSVAKEVIAFLNGRGGDLVIGAEEEGNDNPRIKGLVVLPNLSATVDRLAQILAATIEPYQSVINIRGIRKGEHDSGAIVIRAPASVRAPHRFMRDKECFVRRGRESVAMPMDEIQEMAVSRWRRRRDRFENLDRMFEDFRRNRAGRRDFSSGRIFHIKAAFVPHVGRQVELSNELLGNMLGTAPMLDIGGNQRTEHLFVDNFGSSWKPKLRGKFCEFNMLDTDILFGRKEISTSLELSSEFASTGFKQSHDDRYIIDIAWLIGFLSNTLTAFGDVLGHFPEMQHGILRCAVNVRGNMDLIHGTRMWSSGGPLPESYTQIPDFETESGHDFRGIFTQLVRDICNIAAFECPNAKIV